jgi:hypothetical protein
VVFARWEKHPDRKPTAAETLELKNALGAHLTQTGKRCLELIA